MFPRIPRHLHLLVAVRLASLAIQFVSYFVPDHKADAFSPDFLRGVGEAEPTLVGRAIRCLLDGYNRWDAVYFSLIVRHGYAYDRATVFFPLYPALCRAAKLPLSALLSNRLFCLATDYTATLLACYAVNLCLHLCCAQLLKLLTELTFPRRPLMLTTTLTVFALSPATPFFVSFYSEPSHLACSLLSVACLQLRRPRPAALWLAAAGLCRSNAVLNALLPALPLLRELRRRRPRDAKLLAAGCVRCGLLCLAACAGFLGHQLWTALQFCRSSPSAAAPSAEVVEFGLAANFSVRGAGRPQPAWCLAALPLSYPSLQASGWGVGLLRYYRLRQLPNFLLAAPAVVATVACVRRFAFGAGRLSAHALHLAAVCSVCVLAAHVQISTRVLLSSSPLLYWFLSEQLLGDSDCSRRLEEARKRSCDSTLQFCAACIRECRGWRQRLLFAWCLGYSLIGTALHANFLPWT